MPEHLLNAKEACVYLGIDEKRLKDLVRKKVVPAYRIGGVYLRFRKDQLNIAKATIYEPARVSLFQAKEVHETTAEKVNDFLYFNDFYIVSVILVILAVVAVLTP